MCVCVCVGGGGSSVQQDGGGRVWGGADRGALHGKGKCSHRVKTAPSNAARGDHKKRQQ